MLSEVTRYVVIAHLDVRAETVDVRWEGSLRQQSEDLPVEVGSGYIPREALRSTPVTGAICMVPEWLSQTPTMSCLSHCWTAACVASLPYLEGHRASPAGR